VTELKGPVGPRRDYYSAKSVPPVERESMGERWAEGETAVLCRAGAPRILVQMTPGPQSVGEEGVIDLGPEIGQAVGRTVEWSGAAYSLVRPSLGDLLSSVHRGAQIVSTKDAARLLVMGGIGPGSRIAEAGSGSGALTIALAFAVGPYGHVTSFDRRRDFLVAARTNVERAGLGGRVTFLERDVAVEGLGIDGVSSVVLDLPEPWEVLASAQKSLVVGGYVATFTPTYNQLERTVRALRSLRWDEVRAVELLERGLHVGDGGTRPEFDMLGHTGFLASGRKVDAW
jgi:tRNA (adenine57-N1/adenine58-N1)-methyltransferase catalytic subunit